MIRVIGTGTIKEGSKRPFTTESGKEKMEFRLFDGKLHHTVVAWEDVAKGTPAEGTYVLVEGRLGYRSYENKEGTKVWVTEITASSITDLSEAATSSAPSTSSDDSDLGF